jgi:hypothetical protein
VVKRTLPERVDEVEGSGDASTLGMRPIRLLAVERCVMDVDGRPVAIAPLIVERLVDDFLLGVACMGAPMLGTRSKRLLVDD